MMAMQPSDQPEPVNPLAQLIASQVISTGLSSADLAKAVGEVTLRSQILGASLLTVTVSDPGWDIITSGLIAVDPDGLITQIELEFPSKSDKWWRLCMIEGTTDPTAANLTLTFEDRIVAYLRDHWGPKAVPPGTVTRAQFLKSLADEVQAGGGITFVCPELNLAQPVASATANELGATVVSTATDQQTTAAMVNKTPGLGAGAAITIKGQRPTTQQIADINTAMGVARGLGANQIATEALLVAGIGESGFDRNAVGPPNQTGQLAYGIWQSLGPVIPAVDVAGQATAFLKGGQGFLGGGAITQSATVSDPGAIAAAVEGSGAGGGFYDPFLSEAKAIYNGAGGVSATAALTTAGATAAVSDVSQLTRGTPQNPDEDSWDCGQRLAQQVQWYLFTDGNSLFYMDGPDLITQTPSMYVKRLPGNRWQVTNTRTRTVTTDVVVTPTPSFTFDNTAFVFQATHVKKRRIARRSKVAKPQTPSQILLSVICGIDDYHAGEVVVFQDSGPIKGRWVITDATRNCLADIFTQLTLEPPTAPYPEPQASTSGSSGIANTAAAVASGTVSSSGYVDPFNGIPGFTPGRIDMGVDYSINGTGSIVAMGDGTIYCTAGPGWPSGTFIGLTLTAGTYKGKSVYFAEGIVPKVTVGQTVKRGDVIGQMVGPIEAGWGTGTPQEALAASLNQIPSAGDAGGWSTAAGASFDRLMVSLGAPAGILQKTGDTPVADGKVHGTMPPGYS